MSRAARWTLEPESLGRFLLLLDADVAEAGRKYEQLRQRLIRLLEWRGCNDAAALADRVINRVVRRIDEGATVSPDRVAGFAVGVARLVHFEYLRERKREEPGVADTERAPFVRGTYSTTDLRLRELEDSLDRLDPDDRELVLRYHAPGRDRIARRRAIADELSTTTGALRVRVHRIRQRLERMLETGRGGEPA
ncbi:MAG: hypothetical protein GKS06_06110 [Acidobacteria bacterium]|nr:hypothetical protein [Acidobacteriota bacterium]